MEIIVSKIQGGVRSESYLDIMTVTNGQSLGSHWAVIGQSLNSYQRIIVQSTIRQSF